MSAGPTFAFYLRRRTGPEVEAAAKEAEEAAAEAAEEAAAEAAEEAEEEVAEEADHHWASYVSYRKITRPRAEAARPRPKNQ